MLPEYEKKYNEMQQLNNRISKLETNSDILFENINGLEAGETGVGVQLNKPVTKYGAILLITSKGIDIVDSTLNKTSAGSKVSIYWFNNGFTGTFYDYILYKVVGLGKK